MIEKKKCLYCRKEIIGDVKNRKYCCIKCCRRAWARANPEKVKEINRLGRIKRKSRIMETKKCPYCGKEFFVDTKHRRFCQQLCAKRQWRRLNADKVRESNRRASLRSKAKADITCHN